MQNAPTAPARADQAHYVEQALDIVELLWTLTFRTPTPRDQLRGGIARHYALRPPRPYSRESVATHEAAHFVALAIWGFGAQRAEIYDRGGDWGGHAIPRTALNLNDPHGLVHMAQALLAGPVGEELLCSDGHRAGDHIEELLRTAFAVMRGAALSKQDQLNTWEYTLHGTVALVEFWSAEIRDIARVLARKKTIHAQDRPIARILARVSARPFTGWELSSRGADVLSDIRTAFREFEK